MLTTLFFLLLSNAHADTPFKVDNTTAYVFNFLKPVEMEVTDKKDMFSLSYQAFFQHGRLVYVGGTSVYGNDGDAITHGLNSAEPFCQVTYFLPASLQEREEASDGKSRIINRIEPTAINFVYGGQYKYSCRNSQCFFPTVFLKSPERVDIIRKEIHEAGTHSSYSPKVGDGVTNLSCTVGRASDQEFQNITLEMAEEAFPAGSLKINVK